MKLSLQQMLDYIHCPMFYRFKYRTKGESLYLNLNDKYESDIEKFMFAYHSQLQNGDVVDGGTVKKIWGSLWIGQKNKQDLIFADTGDRRDTWNERRKQGIENLMTYHSRGKKNIGTPVLINHDFEVPIAKGISLTGSFKLIQELHGKVELINFKANSRRYTQTMMRKDVETTAMSYAFRNVFSQKEDNLIVYYVDKNQRVLTQRTENDYEIFKESTKNIALSIRNDLFYIAPNPKCISCVYKEKCDNFLTSRDMI